MPVQTQGHNTAIVLVHGACHGAWCWEDVVPPLASRGHDVVAVDLPMTSLQDDAGVVRRAVHDAAESASRVVVVGHSYGGVVVAEGGHEADLLVFCAAWVPGAGETAFSQFPLTMTPQVEAAIVASDDGSQLHLDPDRGVDAFYNRCSPAQAASAMARLRPMPAQTLNEPLCDRPAPTVVPSTYIIAAQDQALSPSYQRQRAETMCDYIALDADHSVFYSATEPLVHRLDELASNLANKDHSARQDTAGAGYNPPRP